MRGERKMKFNEKLQSLRKEKGLSQEELANLLEVSRQAVSKWESGQTYPEMDKLLSLCKIFGCTLDELTNDDVKEINVHKETKTTFSNLVDEGLKQVKKAVTMFARMTLSSKIKCIIEMGIVFFLLCLLNIPIDYIVHLGDQVFQHFPGFLIGIFSSLWYFLLHILYLIIFLFFFFYIFKVRFLDAYSYEEPIKIQTKPTKETEEEKEIQIVKIHTNENSFLKFISKIFVFCMKGFFLFLMIFCVFFFIFLCVVLIFLVLLTTKGIFYVSPYLFILACIFLAALLLELLYRIIFTNKIETKHRFAMFLIAFACMGVGIGLGIYDFSKLTYIPVEKNEVETKEIPFQENMIFAESYGNREVTYQIDESYQDKMKVEVKYNRDYYKVGIELNNEHLMIWEEEQYQNYKQIMDTVFDHLKNQEIYYREGPALEVVITSSKKNIDTLTNNTQTWLMEDEENAIENEYQSLLEEKAQILQEVETEKEQLQEQIQKLQEENTLLNQKIEDYKQKVEDLFES